MNYLIYKVNFFLIFLYICIISCKNKKIVPNHNTATIDRTALLWGKITVETMTKLPDNSPVYASRALGYLGLTMYESVVNGSTIHKSIASQLNGLGALPLPEPNKQYEWNLALNAGQAFMLKNIFENASKKKLKNIDSLENQINILYSKGKSQKVIDRSISYGKLIASKIFEWSKTDGGYKIYTKNYETTYVFPKGNGYWVPPINGQVPSLYPLQPYYGQNRTFIPSNSTLPIPKFIEYSNDTTSDYYNYMYDVYKKNISLTQAERETAAWWADDPSETFSPPGHSYSLMNQIIEIEKPNIFFAAEYYAKTGMAVADAFINCWKTKYTYHSERPSNYIRKKIKKDFFQFWPEPPFPAFYSGHAVQSAACAKILEAAYGLNYSFVDSSHAKRHFDNTFAVRFKPRKFNSFWETAHEAADSRFYGGIHTKLDNKIGLEEGIKIANNVLRLQWKN